MSITIRRGISYARLLGREDQGYHPYANSKITKKRRIINLGDNCLDSDNMQAFLASGPPNASSRLLAPSSTTTSGCLPALRVGDDIDNFLSSDLELSFASNMSIQSPEKRIHDDSDMMDISPAPLTRTSTSENADLSGRKAVPGRPRPAISNATRLFGRDAGNDASSFLQLPSTKSSKRIQRSPSRSPLPLEWMSQTDAPSGLVAPSSPDAMDVDSSFSQSLDRPFVDLSSPVAAPQSAGSTITGFDSFSPPSLAAAPTITGFHAVVDSPERSRDDISAHPAKKRRSVSPPHPPVRRRSGTIGSFDSSPMAPSSPSALKLERIISNGANRLGKPMLSGLGNPDAASNPNKRPRRPLVTSMLGQQQTIRSAYPIMDGRDELDRRPQLAPTRRAVSAMLPPGGSVDVSLSSESSFDSGVDMSSPAVAHVKRQQNKTLRRIDGTDDFKSTGSLRIHEEQKHDSPRARMLPERNLGLGGFGDNEAAGKILPCHRVREDGLMRIKPNALDDLLDGKYDSQIESYLIIDCRFDYEYEGGHIPGAVNINTTQALEDYFLSPTVDKPIPSTSIAGSKKKLLIFHCEFSVKRAPTFAKYLRSKDRSINGHNYPNVFYPEVYVLEGGFCTFYKESRSRKRPTSYVRMDDPHHATSRKEDLDMFRKGKFGRTRSYAYGDPISNSNLGKAVKRSSAPSAGAGQPLFTAAGNAARTRRSGGLDTLTEDRGGMTDDDETDIGDSPCPPPTKTASFKGKRLGGFMRNPPLLARAETYDPSRFAAY